MLAWFCNYEWGKRTAERKKKTPAVFGWTQSTTLCHSNPDDSFHFESETGRWKTEAQLQAKDWFYLALKPGIMSAWISHLICVQDTSKAQQITQVTTAWAEMSEKWMVLWMSWRYSEHTDWSNAHCWIHCDCLWFCTPFCLQQEINLSVPSPLILTMETMKKEGGRGAEMGRWRQRKTKSARDRYRANMLISWIANKHLFMSLKLNCTFCLMVYETLCFALQHNRYLIFSQIYFAD